MSIPKIDICLECRHLQIDHIPTSIVYPRDEQNLGYCVGSKSCKCKVFKRIINTGMPDMNEGYYNY